ncbi:MAG: thiamine-phosphate kinase [Candidatus Micrarchaeia archaeon]
MGWDAFEKMLVNRIREGISGGRNVLVKAGEDDAAIVRCGDTRIVVTTDMMFRRTHFPKAMRNEEIAGKIVAANMSDLAAMGAVPLCFLLSAGAPKSEAQVIPRIVMHAQKCCMEYGASLVGGDTKKARELTLCGFAVGYMGEGCKPLLRKNARVGDVVAVTGEIGSAACGLMLVLEGRRDGELASSFLKPRARVKEGIIFSEFPRAAAMDITDGLFYTAGEIARESGVMLSIESEKIPTSRAFEKFIYARGMDKSAMLNVGEDYELLVCMPKKTFEEAGEKVKLYEIGVVERGRGIKVDGKKVHAHGYDAFGGGMEGKTDGRR